MGFINSFATWLFRKRMTQIERFMQHPFDTQQEVFRNLIQNGSTTVWGQQYDYKSIKDPEVYRERVPVSNYESLKPYIDRMMKGEQEVLWNTEVRWFAKSSGTTADKSKFIPVSYESLEECHFKGGKDMLAIYCHNIPEARIFSGKALVMGGSHQISHLNEMNSFGDLSAVLMQNLPVWVDYLRVPELSVALMDNWEKKLDKMVELTENEDVTNITGVPTWTLVLMKRLLEKTGKKSMLEIWPNLELYIHGGVSFTPYREQFEKLIPSAQMRYMETYNASEGFFGIQDSFDRRDMLLMLDYGIYYEFMPMSEYGKEHPKTLNLDEVEEGEVYALIISTNGGLWRYLIGDTIRFTSLRPYRFQIVGRTKHFINAFGEELMVDNADKALAIACKETGALVNDYTACPVYFGEDEPGGHEWIIEFEKAPESVTEFTLILDKALQSVNSDYEAKRFKDIAMRPPFMNVAPCGTFNEWLKSRGKLGGQHKVPRLSNDRQTLEAILAFMR